MRHCNAKSTTIRRLHDLRMWWELKVIQSTGMIVAFCRSVEIGWNRQVGCWNGRLRSSLCPSPITHHHLLWCKQTMAWLRNTTPFTLPLSTFAPLSSRLRARQPPAIRHHLSLSPPMKTSGYCSPGICSTRCLHSPPQANRHLERQLLLSACSKATILLAQAAK
jgi:hypothetical protein